QTDVKTTLLDGKAFEKIIQYVRKDIPALLIVGRIGVHSDEDMDIGSNTENLLRSAPCNILVSNRKYVPPIDTLAEYTIAWTEEALRRMEKIPIFARGVAKTAIHRYAIEKGHTIISNTVVDTAIGHILPKGAMDAMRALGGSLDAAGIDRNKMQADESVEKPKVSAATQAYLDRMTQNYFVCDGCGYIGKGETPVKCPVCAAGGDRFKLVDKAIFEAAAHAEGALETDLAYDDVPMQWTKDAKEGIRAVPAGFQRRRAKAKIEKTARKLGMTTITLEYAAPMIQEAASEDYTPIFANKGTGASTEAQATVAAATNGTTGATASHENGRGIGNGHEAESASASPYTWTQEAQSRLERAPEGFMRECTRALIEKHADKIGVMVITAEVAHEGIEQAKDYMAEAMKTGNLKDMISNLTGSSKSGAGH
ncbi:MAG: universal stress protein UspA, partial [Nitrospirae bacterium]